MIFGGFIVYSEILQNTLVLRMWGL